MARSTWCYLKNEKRIGEYEELTVRSVGHWWLGDDPQWAQELRRGFHLYSETGITMIEPTRLHVNDVGAYRDPFKLTYRSYTLQQDGEEKKLDGLLEGAKLAGGLYRKPALADIVHNYIPAMRHAFWGFGMLQTYGAAYTPSGTVMNSLLFQTFDCMRHAQRFVELAWELELEEGEADEPHRPWMIWAPVQALRRFVERALTNFDWAENLVLLNTVLAPLFQPVHEALMVGIPQSAGDWVIPQFWLRLAEDTKRHRVLGREFIRAALKDDPRNRSILQDWIEKWHPLALDAIDGLGPVIDAAAVHGFATRYAEMRAAILDLEAKELASCGLALACA